MIKRKASYPVEHREKMRDGNGAVIIEELLTPDEMYNRGRFYAKMTLLPGVSIGRHIHENEMESFYILSGEAEYSDNDGVISLLPGDTALVQSGCWHSIRCAGDTPLELIAQILYEKL